MIVKLFKKYSISNAMNRSEDNLFKQDEIEENDNNDDKKKILNIDGDSADKYLTNESDKLDE